MKPGIKSTEFWLTLLAFAGGVLLVIFDKIDASWVVPAIGGLTAIYTGARAHTKSLTEG